MTDVFISYSRRDKVFTQKLVDALQAANREVWADWASIPAASDWDAEIKQGIEETNTVLFVLSPEWIKSNECRKEMNHAVQMGKRLVPILQIMPAEGQEVPPELAKLNWVYMRETDDFDKAFVTLQSAMDIDLEWIKTHTRIQVRALEWEKKNRSASFALRGEDLTEGEQFIASGAEKSPAPTHLQSEYVLASRKDATRRQRQTLVGVTIALVVSIVLGVVALFQKQEALRQARIALARQLAAQAQLLFAENKFQIGVPLAIQSMQLFPTSEAARLLRASYLGRLTTTMDYGGEVLRVAFSPDGKYIASGGCDNWHIEDCVPGSTRVWDASTGKEIFHQAYDRWIIRVVSFSPDGKYIVSGGCDKFNGVGECVQGSVHVWEIATGTEISQLNHDNYVNTIAFSPDGKYLISGSDDGTARVWEVVTGNEMARMDNDGYIFSVAFSPDGRFVASGGCDQKDENLQCVTGSSEVSVWDALSGREITHLDHENTVRTIAFSPNGKYMVSGSDDGTARVCEASTGKEVARMTHDGAVNSIAFSPDGRYIVSGGDDKTTRVWETITGNEIAHISHDAEVYSVAFSPNSKSVVTASNDGIVSVWDVATGHKIVQMNDTAFALSPDGRHVVSGGIDGIHLWTMDNGNEVTRITYDNNAAAIALSFDGKYVVSGGTDGVAHIQEIETGKEITRITHDGFINSVAISPNGKYAVSGGDDCIARVWEVATGKEVTRMKHDTRVSSVAFSPDGMYVVSASDGSVARVWEALTGKEITEIKYSFVHAVTFSPDGKNIVTSGWDNTVRIWDMRTGKEIATIAESITNEKWVFAVAVSPDGKYVVSGGSDNIAHVWEVTTGKELARMTHDGTVNSVAFSPDGKYVVSGSDDGTARVWETTTGKEIARITHDDAVKSVAFSPDGKYAVSGGDTTVRIWTWHPEDLIASACLHIPRNLTRTEWEQFIGDAMPYQAVCENLPIEPEVTSTPTP